MTEMRLLVIEDEENLRILLKTLFDAERWSVDFVSNVDAAEKKLQTQNYSMAVVDWMLEGERSGLDFCRQIQRRLPILMLTARSSPADIVLALESGADDYVTKPFEGPVLIARIRSLLRRGQHVQSSKTAVNESVIRMGELEVHTERFQVLVKGQKVELTTSEFKLLLAVLSSRGKVLSRKALLEQIQDKGVNVVERIVDTHIYSIRKKLGDAADFIETIRGVGYRIRL